MAFRNTFQRLLRCHRPLGPVCGSLLAGVIAATAGFSAATAPVAMAQNTPGMEFRWDSDKDYRKLYYFVTSTARLSRSEYYFILRPKDRNTAILKLSITVPNTFDVQIDPRYVKLCRMSEGGMTSRTRCLEQLPATIEIAKDGSAIEVFPNTPIPDKGTIGVYVLLFNPFNIGMYQFNALAQAPGDVPMAGYLGSWVIEIDQGLN